MYQATTRAIKITVVPKYLPEQSEPDAARFVWAYTVEIENQGPDTVQLRTRYWRITDAHGRIQEVRGPGVVGEEPFIAPGERFTYTSGCPLATASGFMDGSYRMETASGDAFDVAIPAFSLDSPHGARSVN